MPNGPDRLTGIEQYNRSLIRIAEPAPPLEPLDIVDPLTLNEVPVPLRRWIVESWFPWGTATGLYGQGGVGKTLIAQQLQTSCATRRPWFGLEVEPVKSISFFCEDTKDELHIRQDCIDRSMGIGFADLENMKWVSRAGKDNLLMTFDASGRGQLTPFWYQVEEAAREFGAQLVILDTAADCFGGNENARPEVRQFIQQACIALAQRLDGAVLLCAHPSLSGINSGRGDGGSTAWTNTLRSRWYLNHPPKPKADGDDDEEQPDETNDLRILTTMKANYGPVGQAITLRFQNGCFVEVRSRIRDTVEAIEDRVNGERAKSAFLAALDHLTSAGRNVSDYPKATNFCAKVMSKTKLCKGVSQKDLRTAMDDLFDDGVIVMGSVGIAGNRHPKRGIVRAPKVDAELAGDPPP